jgi:hypothetical protein
MNCIIIIRGRRLLWPLAWKIRIGYERSGLASAGRFVENIFVYSGRLCLNLISYPSWKLYTFTVMSWFIRIGIKEAGGTAIYHSSPLIKPNHKIRLPFLANRTP